MVNEPGNEGEVGLRVNGNAGVGGGEFRTGMLG